MGCHTAEPLLNSTPLSTPLGDRETAWPLVVMYPDGQLLGAAQRIETGEDAPSSAGPMEGRVGVQWVVVAVLARNGEGGLT
jgi:hypothetical protein